MTASDFPRPQPSSAGPSSAPVPPTLWHMMQAVVERAFPRAAFPVRRTISSIESSGRSAAGGGVTTSRSTIVSGS